MISFVLFLTVCGVMNWGYAYLLAFLLLVVARPLFCRSEIQFNFLLRPEFWLLLLFGVTYLVFGGVSYESFKYYCMLPLVAYVLGWNMCEQRRDTEQLRDWVLALTIGFAVYAALNLVTNIGNNRYQLTDFWNGSFRAATGSGFLNTFIVAIPIYFLYIEKRKWMKGLLIGLFITSVLYMLMLGTRTQFLILFVVSAVCSVLYFRESKKPNGLLYFCGGLLLAALAFLLAYHLNLLGLREYLLHSNMAYRILESDGMDSSNTARYAQFMQGLQSLYRHPLGGLRSQTYYHNLWLDISRIGGILPFLLMIAYTVCTYRNMFRLFRSRSLCIGVRYLLLSIYLAVFMNFFVEPVLEGMLNFFLAFCVINGMVDCTCRTLLRENTISRLEGCT